MPMLLAQFLPTTAVGWLEAIALIVMWTLSLSGLYWAGRRRADRMDADMNGLGDRVKILELGAERRETRIGGVETTVRDHEGEMRRTRDDIGRVMAWMERSHTEQHEMKEELIGFMSERLSKLDASVHDLDKRLAVVQRDVEQLTRDNERRDAR